MLNVINDKQLSNVSFIKDDFINYNNMKYDLIYACDVINFNPNPSKALNTITNSLNDQVQLSYLCHPLTIIILLIY